MNSKKINPEALYGKWVHSKEEDTPEETVFRSPDYEFPPSRGRAAFKLGPNNSYVGSGIGPTDINTVTEGQWKLEPSEEPRIVIEHDGRREEYLLKSAESGKLSLRKIQDM